MAKTAQKMPLPDEPKELIKLCLEAGWEQTREANAGTMMTSPTGISVVIAKKLAYRTLLNTQSQLRRAGLEEDLAAAKAREQARRAEALAAAPKPVGKKTTTTAAPATQGAPVVVQFKSPSTTASSPAATAIPKPSPPKKAAIKTIVDTEAALLDELAGGDMVTETISVTPELAREWLDREPPSLANGIPVKQRPRRETHVLWLAEQMVAVNADGKPAWKLTPQGVALAPTDGNTGGVLDGQHRLAAIELAGKPQFMRVTFNVPPETFVVLDTGKARTAGDVLAITGEVNTHHLASVGKLAAVWQQWIENPRGPLADWKSWNRQKITNEEVLDLVSRWPGIADEMRAAATFCGPPVKLNLAACTVFRIWVTRMWPDCALPRDHHGNFVRTDPDDPNYPDNLQPSILDAWLDQLRQGYNLDQGSPIGALRNWLLGAGPRREPGAVRELALIGLLKAWNNYHTGRTMEYVRIGAKEQMPIPYRPASVA